MSLAALPSLIKNIAEELNFYMKHSSKSTSSVSREIDYNEINVNFKW